MVLGGDYHAAVDLQAYTDETGVVCKLRFEGGSILPGRGPWNLRMIGPRGSNHPSTIGPGVQ